MNKLIFLILLQSTSLYSQPLSSPSGTCVGLKVGMNHCILDPGERFRDLSGKGFHAGIGVSFDIHPYFTVNIAPQIKSSSYICEMWPGASYYYTNLFVPATVTFKPFATLSNSPYLGLGITMNFQLYGKEVDMEWGTEQPIENLRNDLYFTICFGIENKLARLRISPEFSFNYNLTPNHPGSTDIPVSIYDFHLTISLCYAL